jgi:MraZ protein
MFRGVQHINLDAKGRMAVPSRQRELLSVLGDGHIVLTVDTQTPCLTLYPLPEWERIERDVQALPALNPGSETIPEIGTGLCQ